MDKDIIDDIFQDGDPQNSIGKVVRGEVLLAILMSMSNLPRTALANGSQSPSSCRKCNNSWVPHNCQLIYFPALNNNHTLKASLSSECYSDASFHSTTVFYPTIYHCPPSIESNEPIKRASEGQSISSTRWLNLIKHRSLTLVCRKLEGVSEVKHKTGVGLDIYMDGHCTKWASETIVGMLRIKP